MRNRCLNALLSVFAFFGLMLYMKGRICNDASGGGIYLFWGLVILLFIIVTFLVAQRKRI